jgi:hypothetical protein
MATIFVVLNMGDAYFTQLVLANGGIELNPLAGPLGSNILARGVLAAASATVISLAGRRGWLRHLNAVVLWVVVWNLWQYVISQLNLAS